MVERFGIVCEGDDRLNPAQQEMAKVTNREHMTGTLADAVKGADVFFGMSAPQVLTAEMVSTMSKDPMVFAMANPVPEIWPEDAKKGGAAVVGTGRSDYPNQINNVLAFPGIFRGALDVRASDINEEMKLAAAKAIAACVSDEELNAEYIMPMPLHRLPAIPVWPVFEKLFSRFLSTVESNRRKVTNKPKTAAREQTRAVFAGKVRARTRTSSRIGKNSKLHKDAL